MVKPSFQPTYAYIIQLVKKSVVVSHNHTTQPALGDNKLDDCDIIKKMVIFGVSPPFIENLSDVSKKFHLHHQANKKQKIQTKLETNKLHSTFCLN
jgi:hypothetical protein